MAIQVMANLAVDAECVSLLTLSDAVAHTTLGCTFHGDDGLGFHLLCAASNFTYREKTWSRPELIEAIPIAIVCKHILSNLEALRTLCNLLLAPNTMLIESRIVEMPFSSPVYRSLR
jgi:hypothetical protein